ncbi:MAG: hypothetical protein L0387_45920 [Acidobacteria bacterium]|nr:hypothetical protein [Acidobacteriota bacterium]MCI0724159.1 hypothetical protein [Acidobacteriota bacterium]
MTVTRLEVSPENPKANEKVTITAVTTAPAGSCSFSVSGDRRDPAFGNGSFEMKDGVIASSTHMQTLPPPGHFVPVPFQATINGDTYTHPGLLEGEMRIIDVTHGEFPNHNTLSVLLLWGGQGGGSEEEGGERPFIIPGPDMTPENRAFNPKASDKSGRIRLSVKVLNLPDGGRIRWSVPPPPQGMVLHPGTVTFSLENGATSKVAEGEIVNILARQPGVAEVDVEVRDAEDATVESQKFLLCVPQFVTVNDTVDFLIVLERFGLADFQIEILLEAQQTCEHILSDANVRLLWLMPLFGNDLPKHLPVEFLTKAEIAGDQPAGMADNKHLLGKTFDRDMLFADIGPVDADELIFIFPGTSGSEFTDIDDGVRALIESVLSKPGRSTEESTLASTVMGRLIGSSLAHEIGHALVGRGHTSVATDIMLPGKSWTFENMTGVKAADGAFADIGRQIINRPRAGGSLDLIQSFFPVPPDFQ